MEVLFCCPIEALVKYTPVPPDRPRDKLWQDVRLMTKQYYEEHNQKPKEEAPRPTGESLWVTFESLESTME